MSTSRQHLRGLLQQALQHEADPPASVLQALGEWLRDSEAESLTDTVDHAGGRADGPALTATVCRYRKVRSHARGGLGEVFVALDEELGREVALKEIQEQRADDVLAQERFVREARLTGNLEHPGIVPVYGLGIHPDGRPYYAMRFIQGEAMHEAIKRHHSDKSDPSSRLLKLRALLTRFVAVCNAVGYAHSRGVIHRDLKPANVMLGEFGETLVVDWGLARGSVGQPAEEEDTALATILPANSSGGTIGVVGTLAYMSPEQADGNNERVGPLSDIYALGATLYEILTGQPPITRAGSMEETLQRVVLGAIAPPRELNPAAPRALEAIALKALAQRPEDRYAIAQELAAEVERWLADEPVTAHREPWIDRARRWSRKHRTLVTSAVVFLLVGVVGLGGGLAAVGAEQRKTVEERDRALDAEKKATANQTRALAAEKKATTHLKTAEENLKLAKQAVNRTFGLAKDHDLWMRPGMEDLRGLLLKSALPFYKKFREARSNDRGAQHDLATQYSHVGYISNQLGNNAEARKAYQEAEVMFRTMVKANSADIRARKGLAGALDNLGRLLTVEGKRTEAIKLHTQAREIREKLVEENPGITVFQKELAESLTAIGSLRRDELNRNEALKFYQRAREIRQKLAKNHPTFRLYQHDLARTLTHMAPLLQDLRQHPEAIELCTQARDLLRNLVKRYPGVPRYQDDLATTLGTLGLSLEHQGKQSQSLEAYAGSREIAENLVKIYPAVWAYKQTLASTLINLGGLLTEQGKRSEASKVYDRASDILRQQLKASPKEKVLQGYLASALYNKGLLLESAGKQSEALKTHEQARAIQQELVNDHPATVNYQYALSKTLNQIGVLLLNEGKWSESLKAYVAARDLKRKLVKDHPDVPGYRTSLAGTLSNLGIVRRSLKQPKASLADLDEALEHLHAILKTVPRHALAISYLWRTYYSRAQTLTALGRHADAATDWGRFLPLAPARWHLFGRLHRSLCLARAGRGGQAIKEATAVSRVAGLTASFRYDLARVAAISSTMAANDTSRPLAWRERFAEQTARLAVEWLQMANKGGYFKSANNVAQLRKDADFDALRQRADFTAFVASLGSSEDR